MTNAINGSMYLCSAISGVGIAVATVITAYYHGKALLIRARRGDPQPTVRKFTLLSIGDKS